MVWSVQLSTTPGSKGNFATAPTIITHPHRSKFSLNFPRFFCERSNMTAIRNFAKNQKTSRKFVENSQTFPTPHRVPSHLAPHLQRHFRRGTIWRPKRCRFFRLQQNRNFGHVHRQHQRLSDQRLADGETLRPSTWHFETLYTVKFRGKLTDDRWQNSARTEMFLFLPADFRLIFT